MGIGVWEIIKKKIKRDFDEVGRGRAGKKRGVRNKVKRDTRERRKEVRERRAVVREQDTAGGELSSGQETKASQLEGKREDIELRADGQCGRSAADRTSLNPPGRGRRRGKTPGRR